MKVRDIMTADVKTAAPENTIEEIATLMRDEDTGAIPVVDDDELIGLVTDRDIVIRCIAEGENPAETTADEMFSERLETIEPEADVEEAARLMARRQIRRLPVVENGRLVGMVSLGDIAVKASDDQAGEALKEVSHGVKTSSRVVPIRNQGKTTRKRRAS
jgi:CBS domain-containing protein